MQKRIHATLSMYPWLTAKLGTELLGYAYAGRHRERAAYRWSVDVSVYVSERSRRARVGSALYTRLLEILRRQGFRSAFAGIALPNEASVRLHESMGFELLGIYRDVGFKAGRWHDVGWWRCGLATGDASPSEPVPFNALTDDVSPNCSRTPP